LSALLVGCSGDAGNPKVAPVTGTVTYQGKPVGGATVSFIKEGESRSSVGVTDSQGRFQLSTFGNNDGAVIGDNVVTIAKKIASTAAPPATPQTDPMEMMKRMRAESEKPAEKVKTDELPEKYLDPVASGLKAIVSADSKKNDFKFDLVD
jgi:hypothetical protein